MLKFIFKFLNTGIVRLWKKRLYLSIAAALVLNATASDIGTIEVESSTINDKFNAKRTEASSASSVSGKFFGDSHVRNVQQMLQSIPGLATESTTGDSIKVHLRGVENQMYW